MLGLISCDEDFNKDVAPPQTNEQEDAKNADFQVALGSGLSSPLILGQLEEDAMIEAVTVTTAPPMQDGATLSFDLQISKTEDFAQYLPLPSTAEGQTASVSVADLDNVIKELFGKAPNANSFFIRTYVYIHIGTSAVRSNTANIVGPAVVTPVALNIESAYYLIGNMNEWNPDALVPFSHSGSSVYEDPNFSVILEVAANTYFKIAPQSAKDLHESGGDFWSISYGTAVDGDSSLEGTIVTENAGAIQIEQAGYVRISLNMEEYTYKIEPMEANPLLYIPGNHQGWDPASAPTLYTANMDMVYDGFVFLDGEYKFTSAPNWDNTNYGEGGDGRLSTDGSAGNLNAAAGFYYLKADLNTLAYEQTLTNWGIIGDATPGGWDSDTPMTYNRENNTWTVTTALEGGKEFKFRANNSWDINMGGTTDKLDLNGGNIRVETSGNYTIVLRLSNALNGNTFTLSR